MSSLLIFFGGNVFKLSAELEDVRKELLKLPSHLLFLVDNLGKRDSKMLDDVLQHLDKVDSPSQSILVGELDNHPIIVV